MFRPYACMVCLSVVPISAASAQVTGGASAETVLRELEKIEIQREKVMEQGWKNAFSLLSGAGTSPEKAVDLYEEATRQTQFAGASRETAQWQEWREGEGVFLRSTPAKKALMYHLQYMMLTMRRAKGDELEDMLSDAIAFASAVQQEVSSIVPEKNLRESIQRAAAKGDDTRKQRLQKERREREFARNLLDTDVGGSVIARWLNIDGELAKAEKWPKSAGDIDAMLNEVILPELRRKKDQRIFGFWDMKIRLAAEKAQEDETTFNMARFETIEMPSLLWARAQDYLEYGETGRAISEMLAAIRRNPAHPEADAWIERLRGIVTASPKSPASADSPAPSTAEEGAAEVQPLAP